MIGLSAIGLATYRELVIHYERPVAGDAHRVYREQEVEDVAVESGATVTASFSALLEQVLANGVSTEVHRRKARKHHYERRCRYCGGTDHGSQRYRVYDDEA